MISLAAESDQSAKECWRKGLPSISGHDGEPRPKRVHGMRSRHHFGFIHPRLMRSRKCAPRPAGADMLNGYRGRSNAPRDLPVMASISWAAPPLEPDVRP